MRKTKEQNGITLIALIITIIVLLILAVLAIGAITQDGIINHAKNARTEYEVAQDNETTLLGNYLDKINANVPQTENGGEDVQPETPGDTGNGEVTPDDESGESEEQQEEITSITIQGGNRSIEVGDTITLTAYDQNGNLLSKDDIEWEASIASVDENGVVTAEAPYNGGSVLAISRKNPNVMGFTNIDIYSATTSLQLRDKNGASTSYVWFVGLNDTLMLQAINDSGVWVYDEPIIWEIEDPSIASVVSTGATSATVTGLKGRR